MWYLRNFFVLFCLPPKISPFRISLIIEKNRKEQQQQQDGVCWEHVSVLSRLVRHTRQRNWRSSLSYYVPRSRRAFDYVVWLPSLKHTVKIKPLVDFHFNFIFRIWFPTLIWFYRVIFHVGNDEFLFVGELRHCFFFSSSVPSQRMKEAGTIVKQRLRRGWRGVFCQRNVCAQSSA